MTEVRINNEEKENNLKKKAARSGHILLITHHRYACEEIPTLLFEWQSRITLQRDNWENQCTNQLDLQRCMSDKLKRNQQKRDEDYEFIIVEELCLLIDNKMCPVSSISDEELETHQQVHTGKELELLVLVGYMHVTLNTVNFIDKVSSGFFVPPRGEGPALFEKMWKPSGSHLTLSEMKCQKFMLSPRHVPYLLLAEKLRKREFKGLFELHITVKSDKTLNHTEVFKSRCKQIGVKPVLIELPTGENPTQLMTASYVHGTIQQALIQLMKLSTFFLDTGYEILRTKIEAMCSSEGVPETDEEAQQLAVGNYFEFHIKIQLNSHNVPKINELCEKYSAHLSKNAFKIVNSDEEERFVTMRMYYIGRKHALTKFECCLQAIEEAGFVVLTKQREYSVFDSNVALDAGWISSSN